MSVFDRVLTGIKDVILIREEVNQLSEVVKVMIVDLREHDRRLIRLETLAEVEGQTVRRRLPKA